MIIWPAKDPGATENFAFDFTDALNGATISGTPPVTSADVTVAGITVDGSFVRFRLSAGTAGAVAKVNCTATLSNGEVLPELGVLPIGGEIISLAEAKASQRIDTADEDVLLAGLLRAAIGHIERITGKYLTAKVVTQTVDGFPGSGCLGSGPYWVNGFPAGYYVSQAIPRADPAIRLWKGPASSILSIKYDDENGAEQTLSSFRLVEGPNAKLLPAYGAAWPVTAVGPGTVRLTYIAGYDPAELPPELIQAALMLFGHFYANREAVAVSERSGSAIEVPFGVDMLTAPYCAPGIA